MKKKHSLLKDILFLSLSSFLVTAAWVGFNVFHSNVTTTITQELQVQITPIQPEFDTATIAKLKNRKKVTPVTELTARPTKQLSPNSSITPTIPEEETTRIAITPTPTLKSQQTAQPSVPVVPSGL